MNLGDNAFVSRDSAPAQHADGQPGAQTYGAVEYLDRGERTGHIPPALTTVAAVGDGNSNGAICLVDRQYLWDAPLHMAQGRPCR